jgi:cytochrome c oxidase subunit 3
VATDQAGAGASGITLPPTEGHPPGGAPAGLLAHHFDNIEQQREAQTLGMWAFLATEVLVFGALFAGYSVYRTLYAHDFEAASAQLSVLIGAINTLVLLTSSLTMALSVYATRAARQRMLVTCLVLTALLGTAFMGFKAVEYYDDYQKKLVPGLQFDPQEWTRMSPPADPQHVQLMLTFYYIMTGLHAVHLIIGVGLLVWLIVRAWRGSLTPAHYIPVEVVGLYWHFVDVIWIFLLPLLYLTGRHSLNDLHF